MKLVWMSFPVTYFIGNFFHRNKLLLVDYKFLPSIEVNNDVYEAAMSSAFRSMPQNETSFLAPYGLNPNCSLSHQLSQAAEGTGLAFIVFTQAIVSLPGAPFWAVLFFTMLLSLGLGSQIGILEGMLCTLFDIDIFKRLRKQYVTGE